METIQQKKEKASNYLKQVLKREVRIGIILGSGMGNITETVDKKICIPYSSIPGFPSLTVSGHRGEIIYGLMGGKEVLIFSGRFHYYQGYSMGEVVLPVRVAKKMGVNILVITNASGGIREDLNSGDIMLIQDHINFMGTNPLIGEQLLDSGEVFVDMSEPYAYELIELAEKTAQDDPDIGKLKKGVYIAVTGPSYETKAEIVFFKKSGADAVGMSTVPEVIAAVQEGLKVLGISVIANKACGMEKGRLDHRDVLKSMERASGRLCKLITGILRNYNG